MYKLHIKRPAEKDLHRLPHEAFDRVNAAVLALQEDPSPHGVEKLDGGEGWRIRVGPYRVIYAIDDDARQVMVYRVRHRKDAYRRF